MQLFRHSQLFIGKSSTFNKAPAPPKWQRGRGLPVDPQWVKRSMARNSREITQVPGLIALALPVNRLIST